MKDIYLTPSLPLQEGLHIVPWQYSLLQTSGATDGSLPRDPHWLSGICQEARVSRVTSLFVLVFLTLWFGAIWTRFSYTSRCVKYCMTSWSVCVDRYAQGHIWACPPSEGDDYIFHCHPADQKIPKPKRLQEWYRKMLDKAFAERILHDYKVRTHFQQILTQDYIPNIRSIVFRRKTDICTCKVHYFVQWDK